ncbi:polysaccharide biosynthesis/export family protein [Sphingobium mellinum]|uniref:polysaccharide biosynthesis/export family protein n=1 Tax=Sphingobium mellinum TaxID=1387166 RepID=UPI0030ED7BEF
MTHSAHAAPTMTATTMASLPDATPGETVIGAGDLIDIQVYDVPQLSLQGIRVDPAGHFSYPLLGTIDAQGKSPYALSAEVADGLRRYLVNPRVTIFVKDSALNTVTVLGSVTEPGKFKLVGPTSLMDAVALAKGFTRIADQKQVTILRTIGGQQSAALFDMRKIRRGEMADPPLLGGDKVVVGINHLEAAWRDALLAAPLLGIFAQLNN